MRNPLPIQQQVIDTFENMNTTQKENMLESLETLANMMFESSSAAQDLERWTAKHKQA